MFALDEKKYAIEQWNLTKSYTMVRRSFRSILGYHSNNLQSTAALRYIINNFEAHGTLLDGISGKKRIISCKQVNEVKHLNRNKQRISLRFNFQLQSCLIFMRTIVRKRLVLFY